MIATKRQLEDRIENYEEQSKRLRQTSFRDQNVIIPQGWLDCPRFGQDIGFIIPSKVPLSESYNDCVPSGKRYNFKEWFTSGRTRLGLVIDLTNTTRYYHPNTELRHNGIKYVKIRCSGRDAVPDNVSVNNFVYEVNQFENNFSQKYVLVHCTHGHNRTGFMIVHYLMRSRPMMSVTEALKMFSDARPPGIYKPDYIDALYSFYHEVKPESVICPPTPEWKRSEEVKVDDVDDALSYPVVQGNNQEENVKTLSNDDILGDDIPYGQEVSYQQLINDMLNISMQFPGSHPVSLGREALQLLRQRYYYATWKADGTRYMMLLTRDGCYLVNREFRFRRVQMRFPCKYDPSDYKVHHYTLLDGEMVIDTFEEGGRRCQARRYLVYDLVAINGQSVAERPFSERWNILEREVIRPRNDEKKVMNHWYRYEMEPFGVRIKPFCLLSAVEKIPSLSHETDGLIFQGWDDPYVFGTDHGLLKWKFVETLDFLFDMDKYGRQMLFLQERGKMKLMEGYSVEFRGDGWDNNPASYCGKIVECSWDKEKKVWVSLRIRVDKSKPNGIGTGHSVIKCIKDDITKDVLLEEIKKITRLPMYVDRIRRDTQEAERRKHGNRKG